MSTLLRGLPVGVPPTLEELLPGEQEGFKVKRVFFLELEHTLFGHFPAVIRGKVGGRIVESTDPELLVQVWRMLPPRRSRMRDGLFYVNEDLEVGYPLMGLNIDDREESRANLLLTPSAFAVITSGGANPFEWAPGLIGDNMSQAEFYRTIEVMMERAS